MERAAAGQRLVRPGERGTRRWPGARVRPGSSRRARRSAPAPTPTSPHPAFRAAAFERRPSSGGLSSGGPANGGSSGGPSNGPGVPYGEQPYGEQPYGEQPYGEQPYGEQPYGEQPYGEQPYGTDPYTGQAYGWTSPPSGSSFGRARGHQPRPDGNGPAVAVRPPRRPSGNGMGQPPTTRFPASDPAEPPASTYRPYTQDETAFSPPGDPFPAPQAPLPPAEPPSPPAQPSNSEAEPAMPPGVSSPQRRDGPAARRFVPQRERGRGAAGRDAQGAAEAGPPGQPGSAAPRSHHAAQYAVGGVRGECREPLARRHPQRAVGDAAWLAEGTRRERGRLARNRTAHPRTGPTRPVGAMRAARTTQRCPETNSSWPTRSGRPPRAAEVIMTAPAVAATTAVRQRSRRRDGRLRRRRQRRISGLSCATGTSG